MFYSLSSASSSSPLLAAATTATAAALAAAAAALAATLAEVDIYSFTNPFCWRILRRGPIPSGAPALSQEGLAGALYVLES